MKLKLTLIALSIAFLSGLSLTAQADWTHCLARANQTARQATRAINHQALSAHARNHRLKKIQQERLSDLKACRDRFPNQYRAAAGGPCMNACQAPCAQAGYTNYHTNVEGNLKHLMCVCNGGDSTSNAGPVCYSQPILQLWPQ